MSFTVLPSVLQNLVVEFAFGISLQHLKEDLKLIETVKTWNLPPEFVAHRLGWIDIETPLHVYFPLKALPSLFNLFHMHRVRSVLDRLDFRRKTVHYLGSRENWQQRLEDVDFLGLFAGFFKSIADDPRNLRPLWRGFPLI